MEVLDEERGGKKEGGIFEEIMAKDFPNLM